MDSVQRLLGQCIRLLREKRGHTLEQLSISAGITYQYLSGIENGKENFTIGVLDGVSRALDLPLNSLVAIAYHEIDAVAAPKINSEYFRKQVPLPEGLSISHLVAAVNETQLTFHRINTNLKLATGRMLHELVQGNNFSGLVSNVLCNAIHNHSCFKHNSHQRYPDLKSESGRCPGLEVKSTIQIGKGGESHNGHSGWYLIACFEIDEYGAVRFIHLMCAELTGHTANRPDWKYIGSRVNATTGRRRTETYNTTLSGTTKLRDGSVYLDPTCIDFRRWRQDRSRKKPPPWSIFA